MATSGLAPMHMPAILTRQLPQSSMVTSVSTVAKYHRLEVLVLSNLGLELYADLSEHASGMVLRACCCVRNVPYSCPVSWLWFISCVAK